MSKIRNSLGAVVLPALPSMVDPITWDEYKSITGVDLSSIFDYYQNDDDQVSIVRFKKDMTKLILIDSSKRPYTDANVPTIASPNTFGGQDGAGEPSNATLTLIVNNSEVGSDTRITIYGNKTIMCEYN